MYSMWNKKQQIFTYILIIQSTRSQLHREQMHDHRNADPDVDICSVDIIHIFMRWNKFTWQQSKALRCNAMNHKA